MFSWSMKALFVFSAVAVIAPLSKSSCRGRPTASPTYKGSGRSAARRLPT